MRGLSGNTVIVNCTHARGKCDNLIIALDIAVFDMYEYKIMESKHNIVFRKKHT